MGRLDKTATNDVTHNVRVLIVIENMSFTYDTRARKIARTLKANGYDVYVICPRYPGDPKELFDSGIHTRYYKLPRFREGLAGHILEYAYSISVISFLAIKYLIAKRIKIIHVCNPPDFFFPIGMLYRLCDRKFIYDQHDLCPELFTVRFGKARRFVGGMLQFSERLSIYFSNRTFSTNESAAKIISDRYSFAANKLTVIPNTPALEAFPSHTESAVLHGRPKKMTVGYVGNINPQDGIEFLLRTAEYIKATHMRHDIHFVCIGNGGAYDDLVRLAETLGVHDMIAFTGRLTPNAAMKELARCDVCILPDPKNVFTDSCAMVKCFEYMALGKAIVAFDLNETQRMCGGAALFAKNNNHEELARNIIKLADDPILRRSLGAQGRERIENQLNWSLSENILLREYARIIS